MIKIKIMLELRPNCENCSKALAPDSDQAMICSFECTFCKDCTDNILHNVCPNCGGGLEKRPVRPKAKLEKYPASQKELIKPIDPAQFHVLLSRYRNVKAEER